MRAREIIMLFLVCILIAIVVNIAIQSKAPNEYEKDCIEWIEEIKLSNTTEDIEKQKWKCKLVGTIEEAMMKQDLSICNKAKDKKLCKEYAQQKEFGASDIIKIES